MSITRAPILIHLALALSCSLMACATAGESDEPDARVTPIDAPAPIDASGTVDMAPGVDAPGCTDMQLLQNPAFDQGQNGWNQDGPLAIISTTTPTGASPHTPDYVAWFGTVPLTTETLTQDVAIPDGTTALSLSGQRWILTDDPDPLVLDTMAISIRDTNDSNLETLRTFSTDDAGTGWAPFTETITGSYAGQTVRVHIESDNNVAVTSFLVDTLALQATVCP